MSRTQLARVAGALYLLVAACGGWAELVVRSRIKVPGDAVATAANVVEHASLMRLAFAADLVNITCFLMVALVMFAILRPVNGAIAVAMVAFNATAVAIMGVNMLHHLGALLVATVPAYTSGLTAETASALVLLLLDLHGHGYHVAQIFYGLWLLPLGYLVYRSGAFPRLLGVLLMMGCGGYLGALVAPSLAEVLAWPAGLAEISFLLWLLVRGAKAT